MFHRKLAKHSLEILEQRIAPATILPFNEAGLRSGTVGTPLLLHAGEGLTTGNGAGSGTYLLFVEAGSAVVFTTDLNNNKVIDYNEITGIAAGDGLRLLSFVDIHGDIVTNLKSDNTLSDSDNNPINNDSQLRGDGLVLLHTSIDKIELRSLQASDIKVNPSTDQDGNGVVDQSYLVQRLALSSYSIFGSVLVGGTFGSATGGLIINDAGKTLQQTAFNGGNTTPDYYRDFKPEIGSIKTGTAASGQYFTFGASRADDIQGTITPFQPVAGEAGGNIINVKAFTGTGTGTTATTPTTFNIGSLEAGKGGLGAHGGNIVNAQLNGDTAGGYKIIAGNGGDGPVGGAGGSITNFSDLGSITSQVIIKSGDGGVGTTGAGGAGGVTTFGTLNLSAGLKVKLGNGGDGFTSGGNGGSLGSAAILTPEGAVPTTLQIVGTAVPNHIPSSVYFLIDSNATVTTAGGAATSAEQTFTVPTVTKGFSLSYNADTTAYLPGSATALDIENALEALPGLNSTGTTVTVTALGGGGYRVHFDQTGAQPTIQLHTKLPTATVEKDFNAVTTVLGTATVGQQETIRPLASGYFTISYNAGSFASDSAILDSTATPAQVQAAINGLKSLSSAGVTVTVAALSGGGYTVTFVQPGVRANFVIKDHPVLPAEVDFNAAITVVGTTTTATRETYTPLANGSYFVSYLGADSTALDPSATAAQVQAAINGISTLATVTPPLTVTVTPIAGGGYTVTFNQNGPRSAFLIKDFPVTTTQYLDVPDAATLAGRSFYVALNGRAITSALPAGTTAAQLDAQLDVLITGGVTVTTDPADNTIYKVVFNTASSARLLTIEANAQPQDVFGTTVPVDFNEDGVGDFVYSTANPDQLVVVVGSPTKAPTNQFVTGLDELGNASTNRIYLNGPSNVEAMVVGDFNGDGHQDIAVASMDVGAFGGVYVYLSQYEDRDGNGVLLPTEDLNHNGKNDFTGFAAPRISALPSLYSGDPDNFGVIGFRRSGTAIGDLAAGDFDGDGVTDLAAVGTYYINTSGAPQLSQELVVLKNDLEGGKFTGSFYADFGTKATPGNLAAPLLPFVIVNGVAGHGPGTVIIESSKLNFFDERNSIILGEKPTAGGAQGSLKVYDYSTTLFGPQNLAQVSVTVLGRVDTDRDLTNGNNNHNAQTNATLRDFTLLDQNGNGNVDIVALTEAPAGFLVGFDWTAATTTPAGLPTLGAFTNTTTQAIAGEPVTQNSGIFFGDKGLLAKTDIAGIRATDVDDDGRVNDILALDFGYANLGVLDLVTLTGGLVSANNQGANLAQQRSFSDTGDRSDTVVAFDSVSIQTLGAAKFVNGVYTAPQKRAFIWGYANPTENPLQDLDIIFPGFPGGTLLKRVSDATTNKLPTIVGARDVVIQLPITENGVAINAGDGGDGLVGKGGTGGFIGGGLKTVNGQTVGSVAITIPANPAYSGKIDLGGGAGGNGFTSGGNGGSVTGTTLRYAVGDTLLHSFARLVGGTGGFGVAGAGGNGGNISSNSIQSGEIYISGDGGRGLTGGNGGSITGNGRKGLYDSQDLNMFLQTGNGGDGVKRGGDGGTISGFAGQFVGVRGSTAGLLSLIAGDGGTAVSGPGGKGGSLLNNSPLAGTNFLAGEIFLQAGNGAIGTVGGAGGTIANFVDKPSQLDTPTIISLLAGKGGEGVTGVGGAGGGISNINIPSSGTGISRNGYTYNRILAGDGGVSAGAAGGAGGTLNNVDVSAKDGPLVLVAGAGGDGLSAGGIGGSILNSKGNVGGGGLAKVLAIAGAGGDAHAFIPNPIDPSLNQVKKAYGGRVGIGGTGGSITGFVQQNAVGAHVDLIAGNGGSTINYGTVNDAKSFVGRGGSISNVTIAGDIGNVSPTAPIKSYTDLDGDGHSDVSIATFVQDTFRTQLGTGVQPDDTLGNVGIVVGAAGRIKEAQVSPGIYQGQPAPGAINGSLLNIRANNLMSAVAGDVNQIAAIQVAQGIKIGSGTTVFTPGIIGADKAPTLPGADYLSVNGDAIIEPETDGRLVDGALVAHIIKDTYTGNVRVFLR